eukprot:TRINITY_DN14021_c0_g1_i1.p1 TRINITY_DN14021_c0_g1~~TRINITY_DN14021_c0_g1_i1.p1  ORF type:complete len:774 (+),score=147.86 TRINITY_DN14021_c0_g1_i1:56-2377(+)
MPAPAVPAGLRQECIVLLQEIERVTREQDQIWREVGEILTDEDDVGLQVELIRDTKRHQLYGAKDKAAMLAKAIAESAKVAKQSSWRVKGIDQLKAKVNTTLELAKGISKQGSALEGITSALSRCDYEEAAEYISEYYQVEEQLRDVAALEDESDEQDDAIVDKTDSEDGDIVGVKKSGTRATAQLLHKKRDEVRDAIRKEFNQAAAAQDRDGVIRFSKLYGKVGLKQEGMEQYARWLQHGCGAQLSIHVETSLDAIESGSKQASHLNLVSELLDHIVSTIEAEDEHVGEFFGPEGVSAMVSALHQECTKHSVNVLNSFLSKRNLHPSRSVTPQVTPTSASRQSPKPGSDAKTMDQTLEELSHLSHFCFLYFEFLRKRGAKAEPSALFDKLQELLGCYIPLQKEYLQDAFEKALDVLVEANKQSEKPTPAVKMPSITSQSPNRFTDAKSWILGLSQEDDVYDIESVTTFVDDVFFILRTSVERVIHTRSAPIICSIVNIVNDQLRESLLTTVREKLTIKRDASVTKRTLAWMNAADTCRSYCLKLKDVFLAHCTRHFESNPDAMETYQAVGLELAATSSAFEETLASTIGKTRAVITKQLYEKGLKAFDEMNYVIGEEKLIHYEISDAWVRAAIAQWDEILTPYSEVLSIDNMNNLIAEVVSSVVKTMESMLLKKEYDVCGGLQLDRDVRAVKQYFSGKSEKPIREKFTRLTHIAALLIIDKLSEVEDLWTGGAYGSGALMWRLNPDEAKKVLSRRVDLDPQQIHALNLVKSG